MHLVHLNDSPVDWETLARDITPLVPDASSEQRQDIVDQLQASTNTPEDFENYLDSIVESKPALALALSMREATTSISERLSTDLITLAGTALSDQLGEHFIFTANGVSVSDSDPPQLNDSYEALRVVMTMKEGAGRLDNYSTWLLGNLIDELENFHGDDVFDLTRVVASTNKAYNTVVTAVGVYRAFRDSRVPGLSFSHHKEVFYAKLDDDPGENKRKQLACLNMAAKLSLSTKDTRRLCKFVRAHDIQELDNDEDVTDAVSLMDRIATRNVTNHTFIFRIGRRTYRYRGPKHNLPETATHTIDIDAKMIIDGDAETEIPQWTNP